MPYPRKGEKKSDYISRFLESAEAKADFPDIKQRTAVAYSMYERKDNSYLDGKEDEMPWPKSYKCNFIEPGVVHYSDLGPCKVCGDQLACGNSGDECQPQGETILVKQEALDRMASTFIGKPVIDVEHKDVTPSTIQNGEADGIVTRVWKENGWDWCDFLVWNPVTQKHCDQGNFSVSCAYEPTEVDENEGEYHNIPYSNTIQNGFYTHLAIVQSPRYEGARILVNSKDGKGGLMSWNFWTKGARKNAAPIDPEKEMVEVGGKHVSLKNLYDALPEEEKPKYNDDTMLSTPKGDKTLGELKKNYLDKQSKENVEKPCPTCGEKKNFGKPSEATAPGAEGAEPGHSEHRESVGEQHPLPDLRDRRQNDDAEEAAKKLDKEVQEKKALELEQKKNAADAEAKAAEEKKNAEEKAKEEMKQAEEKADKEKALQNAKKEAGRKSFSDLRNARGDGLTSEGGPIMPVSMDDRLAKGKSKYGSPA